MKKANYFKNLILITFIFLIFKTQMINAQSLETLIKETNLAEPFVNIFKTFEKIKIENLEIPFISKNLKNLSEYTSNQKIESQNILEIPKKMNYWFKEKTGVSLLEIIKTISSLFIWLLEMIARMLKNGFQELEGLFS